ncbi:hypothetical protein FQR65_LT14712 [Abscondita terminalis]|nr:hypothetical protein FQR65_LT14712 [Abscondita terminalis]
MFISIVWFINALVTISFAKECGLANLSEDKAFPWNIDVYEITNTNEYEYVCSGTVLSSKLILTVASCLYSTKNNSNKFSINAGQKYKTWNPRSALQEISINNVVKPQKYLSGKHADNIAIIKLDNGKIINLEPVCVNWDNEFVDLAEIDPEQLQMGAWSIGKNGTYKIVQPSFLDLDSCKYYLSAKRKEQFLTYDKSCLQLNGLLILYSLHELIYLLQLLDVNVAPSIGTGVYVFNANTKKWFLIGITSEVTVGESSLYISYIIVNTHLNWISNLINYLFRFTFNHIVADIAFACAALFVREIK